jgi:hypothetical protein
MHCGCSPSAISMSDSAGHAVSATVNSPTGSRNTSRATNGGTSSGPISGGNRCASAAQPRGHTGRFYELKFGNQRRTEHV